ncbi:FadR/GntR family transcriptional regulator [Kribbella sindirgiensis]|uniref:FadR/GntR family transcriptional regulator n=1 Tax=Kribbella sindirgiensis TaxID=1124744 RepID=UPI001EDF0444|nr:GntR family transcriptional regulator [Kribbella sindirgiensis]
MTYSASEALPSLSDRLTESILGIIRDGGLRPGDAIPSARELAKRFAITTPTVREALRKLEATGAVEFRHGSGTYVGPTINNVVLANPHRPPITKDSVLQLISARLVIEPAVAAQSALARRAENLERLEAAVTNALVPPGGPAFALNFHVELAAASGNPLLQEVLASLLKVRVREQQLIRALYDNRGRDHEEHQAIVDAVRAQDAVRAEQLTRAHLDNIRQTVESAPEFS